MFFRYFCLDSFGYVGKQLDKKAKKYLKFVTSQTGKKTITINILPDVSKSKGNQTMRLSQLIEYYVRNIFEEKSFRE